ncbi:MAG: Maf family protein [Arachidicoccus sp.]|nr:Maf family protein [Arachidicoccus sp.]
MMKIILASKSPRRKQLLEQAGVLFEVITVETDEDFPADIAIENVPVFIAEQKAVSVAALYPDRIVVAADTIVTIDNEVIGKPADEVDAAAILRKLSGRVHRVITGVSIFYEGKKENFYEETEVEFDVLNDEQIYFYINNFRPYDKAGAYAIQEWIGLTGIKKINGNYYNVMGLPVNRVLKILKQLQ